MTSKGSEPIGRRGALRRGDDMVDDDFGDFGDELHMVVPPYSAYLRAVRLIAADAAARSGLGYTETEDFRLAVDELCHTLMGATDHVLMLTFAVDREGVVARGVTRRRDGPTIEVSDLSATLVDGLSDWYSIGDDDGEVSFVVGKHRAEARR